MRSKNDNDGLILRQFHKKYTSFLNKYRIGTKKNHVLFVYRQMIGRGEMTADPLIFRLLQKRPARNLSGVTIITLLTSPFPDGQKFSCKHNCYIVLMNLDNLVLISKEPAVARANDFDDSSNE